MMMMIIIINMIMMMMIMIIIINMIINNIIIGEPEPRHQKRYRRCGPGWQQWQATRPRDS
jgi:hypothetical protein